MLLNPLIGFAEQERLDAEESAPAGLSSAQELAPPSLALIESDLALLPVSSLRRVCLSRQTLAEALPWALSGGLAQASQHISYERRDEMEPPRFIRVCQQSTRELMERFGLKTSSERFDFVWAACLGAQRLAAAHGQRASANALLRGYFSEQAEIMSDALKVFPNEDPLPALRSFGEEFNDSRVNWRHIPKNSVELSLSNRCDVFEQLIAKEGFVELALACLKEDGSCQREMVAQCRSQELAALSPAATLLRISRERGAWIPWLANLFAFPSPNWSEISGDATAQKIGERNARAYGPEWPLCAFDPERALDCAQNAQRHSPEAPEASIFLKQAGASALLKELAPERRRGAYGRLRDQNAAALSVVSTRLDERRFMDLMDLIDQQGPEEWRAWAQGDPPSIELSCSPCPKAADWLFGLAQNKASPACVARAVASIPDYAPSQSRPTARWLKERSLNASSDSDRKEASDLLGAFFPLFEALDLARASKNASEKAQAKRALKGAAPGPAPLSKRL